MLIRELNSILDRELLSGTEDLKESNVFNWFYLVAQTYKELTKKATRTLRECL